MSFLWFVAAITFLILWINARSEDAKSGRASGYDQGYWDGYRAFGDKVAELLQQGAAHKKDLQRLIDEGEGAVPVSPISSLKAEETGDIYKGVDEYEYDNEPIEPVRTYAQEVVAPQPILSEEELAAQKEQQTMKNLNILLYVGSFLIVAAAAVFVTLVMPAAVKLLALILVTLTFYASGLALYANSDRLKSAGVAFVGTGLAILPFVGFALTSLGGMSGEVAWFVTSLVGLAAYALAAVRLQSQLVSYLTMAFVLSLALSAVSTLGLGMVWYFIVVIGVSLVCNSLHILWPKAVPKIFAQPIEQTGQLTTPVALVASLFVTSEMDLFMYEVLYGVATAHYLLVWLEKKSLEYEVVVRALAHITLLIVAADVSNLSLYITESRVQFGVWVLVLAALQVVYSLLRVRIADSKSRFVEQLIMIAMTGCMLLGMSYWSGAEHASYWATASLVVIGLTALGVTLRLRQVGWAYVGLATSVVLPYVLGRGVIEPSVSYAVIAGGFVVLALFALMGLERVQSLGRSRAVQNMLALSVGVYAVAVLLSGFMDNSSVTVGWTALATGGIFVALSYLLRTVIIELVGVIAGLVSVIAWVDNSSLEIMWRLPVVVVVVAALALAAAYVHHSRREIVRRNLLIGFGAVVFGGLVFTIDTSDVVVVRTATMLLLVAGVTAMVLRLMRQAAVDTLTQISQISYVIFPVLALFTAFSVGQGWVALVLAIMTLLFWLSSYVEKLPPLLLVGNVALVWMLSALWLWLDFAGDWMLYGVTWIAAAVFYATYWLMRDKGDEWRQWASLGSMWVVLSVSAVVNIWVGEAIWVMASAGSLLAIAATLGVHGYLSRERNFIEIAVYIATFSLQRIVEVLIPETNLVVYGHWWAATIGLMAWWRTDDIRVRSMVALGFVTGSTGLFALDGREGYSLVFLIEHIIILLAGAMLRLQWAMWWGIIATVLAVLYFLRGYTFLVLLFLGFLLILFVIWRLGKVGKK